MITGIAGKLKSINPSMFNAVMDLKNKRTLERETEKTLIPEPTFEEKIKQCQEKDNFVLYLHSNYDYHDHETFNDLYRTKRDPKTIMRVDDIYNFWLNYL